ncbi:MAG: DUF1598 domain-containing protein [Planctomycetota bacterium]
MKTVSDWAKWASVIAAMVLLGEATTHGQGIATIQSGGTQAFVTGVTPVIGPNGGVGGVSVDTAGVVRLAEDLDALRGLWVQPKDLDQDIAEETELRMVSLRRLHAQLKQRLQEEKPITEAMFFLAGLHRVEYVFVVPEQKDVLLAGPAGAWKSNGLGQTVSVATGAPVVRLDDLAVALRCERDPNTTTSCSIEPSEEGLTRFSKLKLRNGASAQSTVKAMERALGQQRVLLTAVPEHSHFAAVMVAADYWMKRYAMGFDDPPIKSMPSYMTLLQRRGGSRRVTSPRWWMAPNYEPLRRAPDGSVWRLSGVGVQTRTQDGVFDARGERVETEERNELAEQWAETMTTNFEQLCEERPLFGELRNCFDLSVIAAIIAHRGLLELAECELPLLLDSSKWTPKFNVPTGLPSKGSMVRVRSGWAVSVSGGVDIDTAKVIAEWNDEPDLAPKPSQPYPSDETQWWW